MPQTSLPPRDEHRLLPLAIAIADGEAVDWTASVDLAESDTAALRFVERLAQAHDVLRTRHDAAAHPVHETLITEARRTHAGAGLDVQVRWGPLIIREKIASGAFGHVYRAWDPRLDREVALKVMPDRNLPDTHSVEEGRLLARIRHPNVVTVYGAERIDGRVGIWTEHITGRTLAEEVAERGPLPIAEVLHIGIQIFRALEAVHANGLLHRDIKAQNVLRDPSGRVVLVDFGTGVEDHAAVAARTAGTPMYLAPEVLQGAPATIASDLYSAGALIYFLASGSFPVSGSTLAEITRAHADHRHVPLRQARPDVPASLASIVEKLLAPFEERQLLDAASVGASLETLSSSPRQPFLRRVVPRSLVGRLAAAFGVLAIALGWSMDLGGFRTAAGAAPARWETRPLTITGNAAVTDISSDGKIVVYIRTPERSLWIRNVEAGEDRAILTQETSDGVLGATMTPDGLSVDALKLNGDLWRVPLEETGQPRRIATDVGSPPGWSPDGLHMAFIRQPLFKTTSSAVIADAEAGGERELATVTLPTILAGRGRGFVMFPATNRPAWSPDGRTIAVVGVTLSNPTATAHVALIDVETGDRREMAMSRQTHAILPPVLQVAWLDETRLAVNTEIDGQASYQLSILDTRTLAWERITNDSSVYKGVSLTRDRKRLVTTRVEERTGIWIGSSSGADMSELIRESASMPSEGTFDAEGNFVYATATPDGPTVWVLRKGTSTPAFVARGTGPTITPAGDAVLFISADDKPALYRAALDGSGIRQLASGTVRHLAISPDSRTVYFMAEESVWAVPVAGGPPRRLASRASNVPSVSPDGRHLLYTTRAPTDETKAVFLVCDLPDCVNSREFIKPDWARPRTITWSPDGKGIAYARIGTQTENIWVQPLDGAPLWQLTHFGDNRTIINIGWSPDRSKLAITRVGTLSDAVVLTRNR